MPHASRATPPDANTWTKLLRPALRIIDSLRETGYGRLDVRLGGGTVLMFAYGHRVSKDIDLFFDDAQALSFLSPRLNDVSAALAVDYVEQANTVKLVLPEGDIDFIVAGTVTGEGAGGSLAFEGQTVALDPPAEILAKKILYRAASFKPRDVVDLATALAGDPRAASVALAATRPVHDVLSRRLSELDTANSALSDLWLTGDPGASFAAMVSAVRGALRHGGAT